jgi:hypothetical protein
MVNYGIFGDSKKPHFSAQMISIKTFANLYNIHPNTATRLLRKLGISRPGRGKKCLLTPIEYAIIEAKIGPPLPKR